MIYYRKNSKERVMVEVGQKAPEFCLPNQGEKR